jgi:hypothetical protein
VKCLINEHLSGQFKRELGEDHQFSAVCYDNRMLLPFDGALFKKHTHKNL